jgi:hypothetical protein
MTIVQARSSSSSTREHGKRKRSYDHNDPLNSIFPSSELCVEHTLRELERGTSRGLRRDHAARIYTSALLQDPRQYLFPRLERTFWKLLSSHAKEQIGWCLQELLGRAWRFVGLTSDLPVFEETASLIQFTLIPGGRYHIGMSPASKVQLLRCLLEYHGLSDRRELPSEQVQVSHALLLIDRNEPDREHDVEPFLLATTPIPLEQAQIMFQLGNQENNSLLSNVASNQQRFRLPNEIEWEYAARGGGWDILFPYDCRIVSANEKRRDHGNPRTTMGLRQVGLWPEMCVADHGNSAQQQKLVIRSGREMWSLIHHVRPARGNLLRGIDRDGGDRMMAEDTLWSEQEVVRLAVDILPRQVIPLGF